jgi:uncharacterized protein
MNISEILKSSHVVAIVGLSRDPTRPSCRVADYLRAYGYQIYPVNPNEKALMGVTSYPNLTAIPEPVDVVDIFRRSNDVLPIVEEAVKIKAKTVWMQEGIVNREAADLAAKAGLSVVMDKCMRKELMKLHQENRSNE